MYSDRQTDRPEQTVKTRSDAAKRGVWSRSTLFATHLAILHTFTGGKMDLLKGSLRKSVPNKQIYPKFSMEMKFESKEGFDWTPRNLWIRPLW